MTIKADANITVERIYPDRFTIMEEAIKNIDIPSLLGYHTPAYMNALTEVLNDNPLYLVAFFEKKVAGFLPLRWRRGKLGIVINSLPFFGPNGGPVLTNEGLNHVDEVMPQLASELHAFASEIGAVSIVCYTPFLYNAEVFEQAFSPDRAVDKFTQYLDLQGFTGWSAKIRHKSVGRAKSQGVNVRSGTPHDIPVLLEIYHENYQRKGILLKPESYFYQVVEKLCPKGIARFTIAEWQERVVACLITIQTGKTVSYNVPCCKEAAQTTQANSLLIDESVRTLILQGYRFWNWESSPDKDHPVYKFKARWGSKEAYYKILIKYLRGTDAFWGLSAGEIASEYPYYFVIPFEDLEKNDASGTS